MKKQLIIFAKNPIKGKVKTRLAATIGEEKALRIYEDLLEYTCEIVTPVDAKKTVYYSDYIAQDDLWNNSFFDKKQQNGADLGERMNNAVQESFLTQNENTIIIGTDCRELDSETINKAFNSLTYVDVVLGPAFDGGYYLIGVKKANEELNHELFEGIDWSTSKVLEQTIAKIDKKKLSYILLKTLSDIDTEDDLKTISR